MTTLRGTRVLLRDSPRVFDIDFPVPFGEMIVLRTGRILVPRREADWGPTQTVAFPFMHGSSPELSRQASVNRRNDPQLARLQALRYRRSEVCHSYSR